MRVVFLTIILCLRSFSALVEADNLDSTSSNGTVSHLRGRIAYGSFASTGQFPFITWLFMVKEDGWGSVCGGTIVSSHLVITAAHCLGTFAKIDSWYGGIDKDNLPNYRKGVSYSKHPVYDIAVILMDKAANVAPAKLPTKPTAAEDFLGKPMIAAGWGRTEANVGSRYLKYTTMMGEPLVKCYQKNNANYVCARGIQQSQLGSGDSGGPLMIGDTLVGVNGFTLGDHSGYARVDQFLEWIATTKMITL